MFGKIIHHLDAEVREMLVKGMLESMDSKFHSGP